MMIFFKTIIGFVLIFSVLKGSRSWDTPRDATVGQFPHLVSLEWSHLPYSEPSHLCGGVILDSKWVLTSAHCWTCFTIGSVVLKAGRHDIAADDQHVQTVNVIQKFINPKYQGHGHILNLGVYDLCLLKVHPEFVFNDRVKAAKLPKKETFYRQQRLEYNLIAAGWGSPAYMVIQNYTKILQTIQLPHVENRVCDMSVIHVFNFFQLADTQMCTRPLDGSIGACVGDYGGPLIQYNRQNEPVVIGIRAYTTSPCNTNNLPPIYTKVTAGLSWIKKTMKKYND